MNHFRKTLSISLVLIASLMLTFVGCSDMLIQMGEIILQIEPADTIRTTVTRYTIIGTREGSSKATITEEITLTDGVLTPKVTIPNVAPGKWVFTVKAYDAIGLIGEGVQEVTLVEGNNIALQVPVTFTPLVLEIEEPTFPTSQTKVYDGTTALPVHTAIKGESLREVNGIKDTVGITATATYEDKDVGTWDITITYALDYSEDSAITGKYAPLPDKVVSGTITPKQLTITAPTFEKADKVYGSTDTLLVRAGSLLGVIDGDEVTVTATATFDDEHAGTAKGITVTYSLSGADAANYTAPVEDTSNTGIITPKPLLFSVTADDKSYDGEPSATGSILLDGVLRRDEVKATGTFAFEDANASLSPKRVLVTAITLTGAQANNYSLATTTTETTALLTKATYPMDGITFEGKSLTYDGTTHSLAIEGTLPSGVSVSYSNQLGIRNAGIHEVIASFSGDRANYEAIADMRATLYIAKKALTTEGTILTLSKPYDKTRTAQVTIDTTKDIGIVAGDDVELIPLASYKSSSVGNSIIKVSYTLGGDAAGNYSKPSDDASYIGEITPIQLTIPHPTFPDSTAKSYDGNTTLAVTTAAPTGFIAGETVEVTASAHYADKDAGNNKAIRVSYALDATNPHAKNYLAPNPYTTTTGTITPIQLSIGNPSFPDTTTKTYDGDRNLRVTPSNLGGFISGETVAMTTTAMFADKDAGNNKAITVSYALDSTDAVAKNYLAPTPYTEEVGTISKKALTVKSGTTQVTTDKLIDNTSDVEVLSIGTLVGVVGDEDIVLGATASYDDALASSNKPITVVYSLSGSDKANYTTPVNNTSFRGRIGSGQLTISDPVLVKSKIYNSSKECMVLRGTSIDGIIGSDSVEINATATYDSKNVGTHKHITVTYSLTGIDADKYTAPAPYIVQDGEIQHKQLFMTSPFVPNINKPYDGNTSVVFTPGTLSGNYPMDDVRVLSKGSYLSPGVGTNKQIFFTYALEGSDADNYIAPTSEMLYRASITERALTIEADTTIVTTEKPYDTSSSAEVTAPGTLEGILGLDEVTVTATASYSDMNAGEDKDIIVTYTLGGKDAEKYQKPDDTVIKGRITPKQLTVTATANSKIYDGTVTTTGTLAIGNGEILGSDMVGASGSFTFGTTQAGSDKSVTVSA